MTKFEFTKMFCYTRLLVARSEEELIAMQPSAHLIDHCGGYELELHPRLLMWDNEIALLSLIVRRLCLSLECHFSDGSIIIR